MQRLSSKDSLRRGDASAAKDVLSISRKYQGRTFRHEDAERQSLAVRADVTYSGGQGAMAQVKLARPLGRGKLAPSAGTLAIRQYCSRLKMAI